MGATTVKLDEQLLHEIAAVKPRGQTLAAFVRESLQRDLRRQQMRKAAETYVSLLETNAPERQALDEWESAALASDPRVRK